jgi:hypothetical protein
VAGTGPVDPTTARELAHAAAGHPATRWQVTLTDPDGRALVVGTGRRCTARGQPPPATGWTITLTTEPLATGTCDHRRREPGYRPSPALARLIRTRHTTCCYPRLPPPRPTMRPRPYDRLRRRRDHV